MKLYVGDCFNVCEIETWMIDQTLSNSIKQAWFVHRNSIVRHPVKVHVWDCFNVRGFGTWMTDQTLSNPVKRACSIHQNSIVKYPLKVHVWDCFSVRRFEISRVFTNNLVARMIKLYERGFFKVCELVSRSDWKCLISNRYWWRSDTLLIQLLHKV